MPDYTQVHACTCTHTLHLMLRASCLKLEINEFGCYEFGCRCSVAEQWWLKPEVSWVRHPAAAGLFTSLDFRLTTSKFIYVTLVTHTHTHTHTQQHLNLVSPYVEVVFGEATKRRTACGSNPFWHEENSPFPSS